MTKASIRATQMLNRSELKAQRHLRVCLTDFTNEMRNTEARYSIRYLFVIVVVLGKVC